MALIIIVLFSFNIFFADVIFPVLDFNICSFPFDKAVRVSVDIARGIWLDSIIDTVMGVSILA